MVRSGITGGSEAAVPLLLRSRQGLGDTLMLTAAVRDISCAYPGAFQISVDTATPEIWENNLYLRERVVNGSDLGIVTLH